MEVFTLTDACEALGVSHATLRKLCRDHGVGHLVAGRLWQITSAELTRLKPFVRRAGQPRKIDAKALRSIRRQLAQGREVGEIAKGMGVHWVTISRALAREKTTKTR